MNATTLSRSERLAAAEHLAGFRQARFARSTGTLVLVLNAEEAGLDTEGGQAYYTLCDDHGFLVSHPTLGLARQHTSSPEAWCEACMGNEAPHDGPTSTEAAHADLAAATPTPAPADDDDFCTCEHAWTGMDPTCPACHPAAPTPAAEEKAAPTKRTRGAASDVPIFDVAGRLIPKGASVQIAAAPWPSGRAGIDPGFTGTLLDVAMRDGVAHTVSVWDGSIVRHVYATRIR